MTEFYSDQFAPRPVHVVGLETTVPTVLPNRRFKSLPGTSRVPIYSTRGYLDLTSLDNPFPVAGDVYRLLEVRSSDRIYELKLWVSQSGYGDWTGTLTADCGLYVQGQNHDGPLVTPSDLFASSLNIGTEHLGTNVLTENNIFQEGHRGWQMWDLLRNELVEFNGLTHDPKITWDIGMEVQISTVSKTGAILLEMIFSPAGV